MEKIEEKNSIAPNKDIYAGIEFGDNSENLQTSVAVSRKMHDRAYYVAILYQLKMPNIQIWRRMIVVIPLVMVVLSYIPKYINSYQDKQESIRLASETVETIAHTLSIGCDYISADDPREEYHSPTPYGVRGYYSVRGYLNDLNEDYVSWVSIDVNDEGIVEKVRYRVEINIEEEKESNIEKIKQDISELNNTIKGMNVPVASEDLLSIYELTEDFWKQFESGSYYEKFHIFEEGNDHSEIYMSYDTTPEEEYGQYSDSAVWLSIDFGL